MEGVDRLRLLASAIGGRSLEVGVAGAGEPAWTDGTTVFVDPGASATDQVRMLAVQASLLAVGSLEPAIVDQLARRPKLARRYLAVEGHRALAANEPFLPSAVHGLIDRGADQGADSPTASLSVARSGRPIADPPVVFGVIRPRRLVPTAAEAGDEATPSALHRPAGARTLPALHDEADADDADDPDGRGHLGHLLSSPVGGQGALGRLLKRLLGASREPGGGGPGGAGTPTHVGRARRHGRGGAVRGPGLPDLLDTAGAFAPQARTYPEWDRHRGCYRLDWCTVHERDPRPEDLAPLALPDGRALRRPLARLGVGLVRAQRQLQGDDIHVDAAVEARVAALAGTRQHEAVYVDTVRRRRDLAVLVLLDVSGSAGEPGPSGRTVHEHQRAAAAALTTALHDLGDRVALHAFHSQGRQAVHVTRVKSFDDRLDSRVADRLGGLVPGAYTRLGAAIRHGASLLEERGGASRRLLLVLSDGFAYDHGYGGRYGEADARRALGEARRRGLGCLCLSVGASTPPAALRRVFGPAAHAAVPTPERLPALIGPLFRDALRSAEAQRRTFQRELRRERRTP